MIWGILWSLAATVGILVCGVKLGQSIADAEWSHFLLGDVCPWWIDDLDNTADFLGVVSVRMEEANE